VSTRGGAAGARLLRFDGVQRAAHWANALLFFIVMATALPLYFPGIEAFVGRRELLVQIHVWAGICLPLPILISVAGPWGQRMRRDLRRVNRWRPEEIRWLRTLGRTRIELDKFNPGQKLNAIFVGGMILVMLGTGIILKWYGPFHVPLGDRTGATFVHDVGAFLVFFVVAGHLLFAFSHPEALRSMIRGWIPERWAQVHAKAWWREERADNLRGEAGRERQRVH
jgi:formate dehydrogenase subunit gamma